MKLKAPSNRVIIKIDLESKNSHTFQDGTKIRLERGFDNFNMRHVKPVNATVIDAKYIPEGSDVLIHHNSTHDTHRLFNYLPPTEDASTNMKYFSIPEAECFFWRKDKEDSWKPLNNFVTALRIFKPYTGSFSGIDPELIKDTLYITSGEFCNKVCKVVKAADYEIIYQGDDGVEKNLIRTRHYENEHNDREEIIAVDHNLTEMVHNGELLIGYNKKDAKKWQK